MADVLIVEDDEDLAELTAMMLEAAGHRVRRAADGRAGLRELEARLPEVIVLDVEMPLLDGPDMAYRMFVEDSGKERIPIVLLSAVVALEGIAARVGTPYFLAKPCESEALVEMVARAERERRAPVPAPRGSSAAAG